MDWKKVKEEASEILSAYIRYRTVNPPGDEEDAARFLIDILKKEGIPSEIFLSAPRRANVLSRLESKNPKGLIFLSHIDVVPADATKWDVDPFGGVRKKGYIWGRGALDDKGMGVMALMALILARRNGLKLARDVVFLATADEEVGGDFGAGYMVKNHRDKLKAACLLNEGGVQMKGLLPNGRSLFMNCVGEKGPTWLELKRAGTSGHGSVPLKDNAIYHLSRSLVRIAEKKRPIRILDEMEEFFYGLGCELGGVKGFVMKGVRAPIIRKLVGALIAMDPQLSAMIRDTVSLTKFTSGTKENVIPDEARATIDNRLLPGTDIDEYKKWLKKVIRDENIEISEILTAAPSLSSYKTEFFNAIQSVAKDLEPKSVTLPMISTGFTDSRFFRELGIASYGLVPGPVTREDIKTIHGRNERISEESLLFGIRFMYNLILKTCT